MKYSYGIALLLVAAVTYLFLNVGVIILMIVGIPAVFAFLFWKVTYLNKPTEPSVIIPFFLATVAGFEFHVIEEYKGHYAPAISRIFNFAWPDDVFIIIICILAAALSLVAIGLYYKHPVAGFIAILFIFTRFAELFLFIFPFIKPKIKPDTMQIVSEVIHGKLVENMPNYFYSTTGHFYFPGIYSIILPILPAVVATYIIWKKRT